MRARCGGRWSSVARTRSSSKQYRTWAAICGGTGRSTAAPTVPKKRTMSAAGRRRVAAAQRKRWAELKKAQTEKAKPVKKRKLSAAGRKRIIAATKKRWAEYKAKKATA